MALFGFIIGIIGMSIGIIKDDILFFTLCGIVFLVSMTNIFMKHR